MMYKRHKNEESLFLLDDFDIKKDIAHYNSGKWKI